MRLHALRARLAFICLLVLTGCGGGGAAGIALKPQPSAPGMPQLPAPASLLANRELSFTEAGLVREGDDFEAALLNNNVTSTGSNADFAPQFAAGSNKADLAYAVYSFGVDGYNRDLNLQFRWTTPPAQGTFWVALANFATNRWEIQAPATVDQLDFANVADFTGPAPDFNLFAAIIMSGSTASTLDNVRVGTHPVPVAKLTATPQYGPAPLNASFDASGSTVQAPATITKYEFDFDEGAGFTDNGGSPNAAHNFAAAGTYTVQLRVTDSFGGIGTTQIEVKAGYDEVEDNDTNLTAQALPALPVKGFLGNCGPGGANDGDTSDYFSFSGTSGDIVSVLMDYSAGDLQLELYDGTFAYLSGSYGATGSERIDYTLTGIETMPLVALVYDASGTPSDYLLSVHLNGPAASLAVTPDSGATPLNAVLDASASTDPAPGSIASYEFDPEGTGTYGAPQPGATLNYSYTVDGLYYAKVRVTDDEGNSSTATHIVLAGNVPYDEREDNDDAVSANSLTLPVVGFRGSMGSGPGYPGYDGDQSDNFKFTAAAGDVIGIEVDYASATGSIALQLLDANGNFLAQSFVGNGHEQLTYQLQPADAAPFQINLTTFGGFTDYTMKVTNGPPTALCTATPGSGMAPLNVAFDASASSDVAPGTLVSYELDPEGDGTFEAPQAGPMFNHSYGSNGLFEAQLRVTDNDGNTATSTAPVFVGANYDEHENNDSNAGVNVITLPAFNYKCSLGQRPGYDGYDGDSLDVFNFNVAPGDPLKITLIAQPYELQAGFDVFDGNSNYLGSGVGSNGRVDFSYTVLPGDVSPFYVQTFLNDGGGDYRLAVQLDPPVAAMVATPSSVAAGAAVTLDASGSTDTGVIVAYAFDPEGDGTFLAPQAGATLLLPTGYAAPGVYAPLVLVQDNSGNRDIARATVLVGTTFSETEDNDLLGGGNPLPAFPFTNYTGSLGFGPGYGGYDGDRVDCFAFNANPATDTMHFTLTYNNAGGELSLRLFDNFGIQHANVAGVGGVCQMDYAFLGFEFAPYTLQVGADFDPYFYGDYVLAGSKT